MFLSLALDFNLQATSQFIGICDFIVGHFLWGNPSVVALVRTGTATCLQRPWHGRTDLDMLE
jgi:hypothetical protein